MPHFLETIFFLDATHDLPGLVRLASDGSHPPTQVAHATTLLLFKARFRSAFVLARLLASNGYQDPIVSMALALGGLLYGMPSEKAEGLKTLQAQVDAMPDDQQTMLYKKLVIPVVVFQLLGRHLQGLVHYSNAQIRQFLEVVQAAAPRFRTLFDWDAPVPHLTGETMRQQGRSQARLLHYPQPPPDAPRPTRRAVVAFAETHDLGRANDIGPRIKAALHTYGWHTTFLGLTGNRVIDDCQAIRDLCQQQDADLLVLEFDHMLYTHHAPQPQNRTAHPDLIAHLRQEKPNFKVVGCLCDAWSFEADLLTKLSVLLDVIWDPTGPSLPVWDHPAFAHKMLHTPFPSAGNLQAPDRPLIPHMLFSGGIRGYNWHRLFWLTAAEHLGLPIHTHISRHQPDGLSALDSYAAYMQTLADATCCLSLTMRTNQVCITTGRSFEAIFGGALLVEEWSPNMPFFFVSGEHYLAFSTLAELSAVARFVTDNREEAEEIRRSGHAFARERYGDTPLIGTLDRLLYFPDQVAAGKPEHA